MPAAGGVPAAASREEPKALQPGQALDFTQPLMQVAPRPGFVSLLPRKDRPLVLFFWSVNANIAKDDLVRFDRFVHEKGLLSKVDAYAVAGYKSDKQKPDDAREMAAILGLQAVPVLCDPDFALCNRVGAEQFPEIVVVDRAGTLVARGLRGLDHGGLPAPARTAQGLITLVAEKGTAEVIRTVWPFYPTDRLVGRRHPDFELPRFAKGGYGKGPVDRLSKLLSGERPAVLLWFSSTCDHCQVDVPQLVKFLKDHPGMYEVVGITRIKSAQHRAVSEAYFRQQGITFPVLEDLGAVTDLYGVTSTPTAVFLSPQGAVVSVSYTQHETLEEDFLKLHPNLVAAPPPQPIEAAGGWRFPLKVKDETGKVVDLARFAGKPTILHFWATWCTPCRTELPQLLAALPVLQASGNVVLVSVETDEAALQEHRKATGLPIASFLAPHDGLATKIDFSRSVPRTYVLDATGKVVNVIMGTHEWRDADQLAKVTGRMLRP
jgi:thiol-disulfide isomerase/thioredoxin